MTDRGADAIGAGIAPADDDDILAASRQPRILWTISPEQPARVGPQVIHGEMNASQLWET